MRMRNPSMCAPSLISVRTHHPSSLCTQDIQGSQITKSLRAQATLLNTPLMPTQCWGPVECSGCDRAPLSTDWAQGHKTAFRGPTGTVCISSEAAHLLVDAKALPMKLLCPGCIYLGSIRVLEKNQPRRGSSSRPGGQRAIPI